MSNFNIGLPSTRLVQSCIKEKQLVEIKLVTGDLMRGKVIWQDDYCICLVDEKEQRTIIWRPALVYIKT